MREENIDGSLKKFIDDHYRVLAIMGAFMALTGFFTRIEGGGVLASSSFMGFILIDLELCWTIMRLPKISKRLLVFQAILGNLLVGVTAYTFTIYQVESGVFLVSVLLVVYGGALLKVLSRLKESWRAQVAVALISTVVLAALAAEVFRYFQGLV